MPEKVAEWYYLIRKCACVKKTRTYFHIGSERHKKTGRLKVNNDVQNVFLEV